MSRRTRTGRTAATRSFAARLLRWWDAHGRKDLPWQRPRTAYRVWVSEVMLQQTQVATVIPYFERFMTAFPDVNALARANLDAVMHHWAGLGYYARGRNLHAAARHIVEAHGGGLPCDLDALMALPGIGRSTAGAIAALAFEQRHPILDGNVKRVLARHAAVAGTPGSQAIERTLWALADAHTPHARVADYTQAIMDLGATVCVRTAPRCGICPVAKDCRARAEGRIGELAAPRLRQALPVRRARWLVLRSADGTVLLEQRPPAGIWGGLWSFPEAPIDADPGTVCRARYGFEPRRMTELPKITHGFTHFRLELEPVLIEGRPRSACAMDATDWLWYNGDHATPIGLAAPVSSLMRDLFGGAGPRSAVPVGETP